MDEASILRKIPYVILEMQKNRQEPEVVEGVHLRLVTNEIMIDVDIENERILKEYIDGDTIYELILQDKMTPAYVDQLHSMCVLLYAAHTNIDYFPTNFVVQNGEICYVNFECNEYMEEWNFENWGVKYWSKTPEFMKYVEEHS
ncbi:MAG: hypothetical protein Q4C61_06310 [Lachnospiraceae bacterium]|nr:hypothetical protein [Lachnospiraceae bacterium]